MTIPLLDYIVLVEGVSTLGAELRRLLGVCRRPTALVALVLLGSCRLRLSAVGTELACVCSAAFAGPFGRLGSCRSVAAFALSAVSAEFTAV